MTRNLKLNNRWKVVLMASFFAWFMEYSLRGINNLVKRPEMAILVFANYFAYLALIEDFIGRFKLKDYQVWIVAQFFGLLWQLISVAGVYYPPFLFGIGIGTLLINNLVWWTTIQTVFAMYIAHRLTPGVDRSKPLLPKTGIFVFFVSYVLISVSWRLFATPPVTPWQFLVMLSLTSFFGWFSYKQISANLKKQAQLTPFKASKFLDWLAAFTIVYLTFSFFFLTGGNGAEHPSPINRQALRVNLVVSPLIALALLLKRVTSKKPISV